MIFNSYLNTEESNGFCVCRIRRRRSHSPGCGGMPHAPSGTHQLHGPAGTHTGNGSAPALIWPLPCLGMAAEPPGRGPAPRPVQTPFPAGGAGRVPL